jgi:hypothetical protein
MIAERPKNSEVEEPSLSLFAGLSFPDVPNHPIIRTKQIEAQSIQEREEDEIDSSETSKLLSNELKQPVNTSISSVKKQTNLSALYATEVMSLHLLNILVFISHHRSLLLLQIISILNCRR